MSLMHMGYREIGKFFTYFTDDFEIINAAMNKLGYETCVTPTGDVSIMKYGEIEIHDDDSDIEDEEWFDDLD